MSNTLKFGNGEWYGKDGTILAYNDENNNYKPLLFNFDRASSATRVNKDGLIETVGTEQSRVDYKDDSKGALLLEPQRTNLVTYSEAFDNAYWSKSTSDSTPVPVVTSNYATSPDGKQTAERVQLTLPTDNEYAIIERAGLNPNAALGSTIYQSIYLKATDVSQVGKKVDVYIYDTTNSTYRRIFNHVLTNDWERIESNNLISFGLTSTSVIYAFGKARANSLGQAGTTGTITSEAATDFLVWGAQLEAGSYATSYIPTQGSAVTRVAESCSQTPPSGIIGQTEGTIFLDFVMNNNATDMVPLSINGSDGKLIWIRNAGVQFYSNGTTLIVSIGNEVATQGTRYKIAFVYGASDFRLYRNGSLIGATTGSTFTGTFSNIALNSVVNQSNLFNQVSLFTTKLTNAELASLTTL